MCEEKNDCSWSVTDILDTCRSRVEILTIPQRIANAKTRHSFYATDRLFLSSFSEH
jgi:hypothetical protein